LCAQLEELRGDEAFRDAVSQSVALEVQVAPAAVSIQGIAETDAGVGWVGLVPASRRRLLAQAVETNVSIQVKAPSTSASVWTAADDVSALLVDRCVL